MLYLMQQHQISKASAWPWQCLTVIYSPSCCCHFLTTVRGSFFISCLTGLLVPVSSELLPLPAWIYLVCSLPVSTLLLKQPHLERRWSNTSPASTLLVHKLSRVYIESTSASEGPPGWPELGCPKSSFILFSKEGMVKNSSLPQRMCPEKNPKPSVKQERGSPVTTDPAIELPLPPHRLCHSLINMTQQNCTCMSVTDGAQRDLSSTWGKLLQGARRGNCHGGKADTRESVACSGDTALQGVPAGHQKMAKKKVNSILQYDKRLFFFFSDKANLLCCVHGRRAISDQQYSPELQSSQVQSTVAVYTRQPFLLIFNFTHTQFKIP